VIQTQPHEASRIGAITLSTIQQIIALPTNPNTLVAHDEVAFA
jgi:hypothetical protein